MRGFFAFSAWFAFWPFEGGSEELPGVLGGTLSLASSSATRAMSGFCSVRTRICSICAKISATSSSLLSEFNCLGSHPELESVRHRSVNLAAAAIQSARARQGVSSYDFSNLLFEQIKKYCALELEALSKALTVLRDGFDKMDGIRLKAWTGSGAAAGAFIKKLELKDEHYSPDIASNDLSSQQVRAHHAYVGGRIELLKQGYARNRELFVYDIASAYPAGLERLHSMKDGTWEHDAGDKSFLPLSKVHDWNMLSMFCVEWKFDRVGKDGLPIPFYPFPYRVKKKGQILFPSRGKAWLMRDELVAGIEWCKVLFPNCRIGNHMIIKQWSIFHPANDEKHF